MQLVVRLLPFILFFFLVTVPTSHPTPSPDELWNQKLRIIQKKVYRHNYRLCYEKNDLATNKGQSD